MIPNISCKYIPVKIEYRQRFYKTIQLHTHTHIWFSLEAMDCGIPYRRSWYRKRITLILLLAHPMEILNWQDNATNFYPYRFMVVVDDIK